jgi:fermentation-respiration switch protein FrsA (DUF1100 family)
MKNRYDSLGKIGRCKCPLLISHGQADDLVPYAHSRKLFEAAPGPKTFIDLEGGHNDEESPGYYLALDRFLDSLPSAAH